MPSSRCPVAFPRKAGALQCVGCWLSEQVPPPGHLPHPSWSSEVWGSRQSPKRARPSHSSGASTAPAPLRVALRVFRVLTPPALPPRLCSAFLKKFLLPMFPRIPYWRVGRAAQFRLAGARVRVCGRPAAPPPLPWSSLLS